MPVIYEEVKLDLGYRIDMLVGRKLLVETKAVDKLTNIDMRQVGTYLTFSNLKLGLLINFNVILLKDGVKRIINGYL